jgi:hypothetical protein
MWARFFRNLKFTKLLRSIERIALDNLGVKLAVTSLPIFANIFYNFVSLSLLVLLRFFFQIETMVMMITMIIKCMNIQN